MEKNNTLIKCTLSIIEKSISASVRTEMVVARQPDTIRQRVRLFSSQFHISAQSGFDELNSNHLFLFWEINLICCCDEHFGWLVEWFKVLNVKKQHNLNEWKKTNKPNFEF